MLRLTRIETKGQAVPTPCGSDMDGSRPRPGRLAAAVAALVSALRGLPFFVARRPGTPLRILCLMAFDTVHVLRRSRRLSPHTLRTLATLLDFGSCANDFFDNDGFSLREYRDARRLLDRARPRLAVNEYVRRLRVLERRRPSPGGDSRRHREAQRYRESVVRLSLGMIAATALDMTIEEGVRATHCDKDLATLYRIVMLCQIIDDVLDFDTDRRDGLPGFLTAHASPLRALALTSAAATWYADRSGLPSAPDLFPFRAALWATSILAQAAIQFGRCRLRWRALSTRATSIADVRASTDARS